MRGCRVLRVGFGRHLRAGLGGSWQLSGRIRRWLRGSFGRPFTLRRSMSLGSTVDTFIQTWKEIGVVVNAATSIPALTWKRQESTDSRLIQRGREAWTRLGSLPLALRRLEARLVVTFIFTYF